MKTMKTKTNMNTSLIFSLSVLCSLFLVLSCEQPFKAGLGPVVDIRPPNVKLSAPSGVYIRGQVMFTGTADDDYKLEKVEIKITNKPDEDIFREYTLVNMSMKGPNKANWEIPLDTRLFKDGPVKIKLRATDSARKETETEDLLFQIKNDPPDVNLVSPFIRVGGKRGDVGGSESLNWRMGDGTVGLDANLPGEAAIPPSPPDDEGKPAQPGFNRKLEKGVPIQGNILYEEEVWDGPAGGDKYPPQIRLWTVDQTGNNVTSFVPGYWPTLAQVPWENLELTQTGLGRYSFKYILDDADVGKFYGFEIRVLSKNGSTKFNYPRDFYEPAWDAVDGGESENRYVLFYIKTQTSFPEVSLYENRENLASWNQSTNKYDLLPLVDENDPVDRAIISTSDEKRNGPFTLRYYARHTDDIFSAEIYWEREGSNPPERGRFIWDSTPDVETTKRYIEWGSTIPPVVGIDKGKNFVFTYTHPNSNEPNQTEPGYGSKVQQYTGNLDWPVAKLDGTLVGAAGWTNLKSLKEGVYKLEVIARYPSYSSGKINWTPYRNTIRLDLTPPEARIINIKGMYEPVFSGSEATVNGVVEPEALFSDWRDSTKLSYYLTADAPEQRWLLLPDDGSKDQLQTLINTTKGGYWPPVPNTMSDPISIPQVNVIKHGPLVESKFRLKTSGIYANGETLWAEPPALALPADKLPDGVYWLYVAVRDEAFNVGYATPVKITVDESTDEPKITLLSDQKEEVITPDLVWPLTTGFETGVNVYRNRLAPNTHLRLRLSDDDGLDLANATVTIAAAVATDKSADGQDKITIKYSAPMTGLFTSQGTGESIRNTPPITILQNKMVEALNASPNNTWLFDGATAGANLPEGIYRLQINVDDYNDYRVKLNMKNVPPGSGGDPVAVVKKAEINIWFYVDNTAPEIKITDNNVGVAGDDPSPDVWINPTNGLGAGQHGVIFKGTIADFHGPVTVKSATITPTPAGVSFAPGDVTITRTTGDRKWTADFTARVTISNAPNIQPASGYTVKLEVQDRFGRTKEVTQKYQVDLQPPEVNLQTPIETFERKDPVRLVSVSEINQERLANGVVYFNIGATDNRQVKSVRWWLLPGNTAFGGWEKTSYSTTETGSKKYYYQELTSGWSKRIFVDTEKALDDNTEYTLYIMARDSATLESEGPHNKQTFFVRQQEDAPYFERQAGGGEESETVVDKAEMIISVTITDDDGFFVGGSLRDGTLKIYLDTDVTTHGPADVGTYIPATGEWSTNLSTSYGNPLILKHGEEGARIVSQGKKQVTLTLDLNSSQHQHFKTKLSGDGRKHYIIEAEDSWDGKFTVSDSSGVQTDAPAATSALANKKWRQYYTMVLDANPPEIAIATPMNSNDPNAETPTFGATTTNFNVTGYIKDLYLKQKDNNYYFKLKLDGADLKFDTPVIDEFIAEFKLGTGPGNLYINTTPNPIVDTVNFTIPSAIFTSAIKYSTLTHGRHTLTFIAEDKSGKSTPASINFIRDLKPPTFRFASGFNDTKTEMPKVGGRDWWEATNAPADYTTKRGITTGLPPVYYEEGTSEIPSISGTFSDDYSEIVASTFKIILDGGTTITIPATTPPQIEGEGTSVNWTVYLTDTGTAAGNILHDGVHSIQLEIADKAGNVMEMTPQYGLRLISKTPTSKLTFAQAGSTTNPTTPIASAQKVYGDRTTSTSNPASNPVFTIRGEATGYNLAATNPVQLIIRYTDTVSGQTFTPRTVTPTTGVWSYTLTPSNAPTTGLGKEDVLETYTWTYTVPRSDILAAGRGSGAELTKMRAGTYEIAAIVSDRSAPTAKKTVESADSVWQFSLDTEGPKFSFPLSYDDYANPVVGDTTSRVPTFWLDSANINSRNVIQDADNPLISGSVTDGSNLADVELQISKWNYGVAQTGARGTVWQLFNKTAPGSWVNWTAALADNANYWIQLNTVSIDAPNYSVRWAFDQLKAMTGGLEDGYYCVRLRARDTSTSPGGATGWTADNNGNPTYSPFVFFFLDRSPPDVAINEEDTGYFSVGNAHSFSAAIRDRNMIDNVVISVVDAAGTLLTNPASVTLDTLRPNTNVSWPDAVNATTPLTFPTTLTDGSYRIIFTVTDFAGKTTTKNRTIRVDNTPPTVTITEPREPTIGGETFIITGSTNDTGPNGSASGVQSGNSTSGIWYHLGYGSRTVATLAAIPALPANPTAEQRKARSDAIMTWVLGDGFTGVLPTTTDTGSANNTAFDNASRATSSPSVANSLWFKYITTDATYIVPPGFGNIDSTQAADLLTWVLNASGTMTQNVANNYSIGTVSIRGTNYSTTSARRLARESVDPSGRSSHSLPLVVRVVDNAGNVTYELHDIRLDPNGDNPKAVFNNPGANSDIGSSRGGQMQINGIAKDNIGVRKVIYRVKTNNQRTSSTTAPTDTRTAFTTTANGTSNDIQNNTRYFTFANHGLIVGDTVTVGGNNRYVLWVSGNNFKLSNTYTWPTTAVWNPAAGNVSVTPYNIIAIPNQTPLTMSTATDPDIIALRNTWGEAGKSVLEAVGTGTLSQIGWYEATLGSPLSATSDWSFMLNQGGEITAAIANRGFREPTDSPVNTMIRVWIEMLVFDDDGGYHLMSLGDNNNNANQRRPYYREFFFTSSSPEVTEKKISELGGTSPLVDYTSQLAQDNIRGKQFAIQAKLNGNGTIGQIQVELPGETTPVTSWVVYDGNVVNPLPAGLELSEPEPSLTGGGIGKYTLTWQFDTTINDDSATHKSVRGGTWDTSGGTFSVKVTVKDAGTPPAEDNYTFEIGIDNFTPLADTVRNITPTKVAGTAVTFLGRVFDYQQPVLNGATQPLHQGLKEVYAWFTDRTNANYLNMTDGTAVTKTGNSGDISVRTGRTADITWNDSGSATRITNVVGGTLVPTLQHPTLTNANLVKVISETTATTASGMTWSPNNNDGSDISWQFVLDTYTTMWPDGWIKLHYVVIDKADNASYYTQDMIVMNKVPQISKITLYTNNTGEGAVFTTHDGNDAYSDYDIPTGTDSLTIPYPGGYLDSGFISKNSAIGFGVKTVLPGGGNPPISYQARYVQRYKVPLTANNLTAMANRSGTLNFIDDTSTPINSSTGGNNSQVVTNFVNLYTITGIGSSGIDAAGWRLLGVTRATPVDGTHFVFRATAADVATLGFPDAYVWAYQETLTTAPVIKNTPSDLTEVKPAEMYFSTGHFGGANKINEAQAITSANALNPVDNTVPAIEAASQGTAFFLINVWDKVDHGLSPDPAVPGLTLGEKDMLYDAIVIGMKVYVGDRRQPFARLYDLNPYMEAEVSRSNIDPAARTATLANAGDPIGIGENILRGGLYNVGTIREPIKSGYIDPRGGSTALYPYVNNPSDPLDPYLNSQQSYPDGRVSGDSETISGTNRDKVSGRIILRGLAWDDQLINTVKLSIGGDTVNVARLEWVNRTTNGVVANPPQTDINDGVVVRKMVPYANAWIAETIHWQTGHTVEWAYLWDTETIPSTGTRATTRGGPLNEQLVKVTVTDKNGNPQDNDVVVVSAETAPTKFHNSVNVDIVPYITEIKRDAIFATTRSRQGWYSFYQGETGIRLVGYNLGTGYADDNSSTRIYLNKANANEGTNLNAITDNRNYLPTGGVAELPNDGHTFAIPATAESSRINVAVNGTGAINQAWNHSSVYQNKSWNSEKSTVSGSDLWTNRPYAHIWRTLESGTAPATYFGNNQSTGGSLAAESPSMALEFGTTNGWNGDSGANSSQTTGNGAQPGRLHGLWSHRSSFRTYYAANDNGAAIRQQEAQDPQAYTDIAYYPGTNNANNITAVYVYQWDALPNILLRTHMRYLPDNGSNEALGINPGGTIVPFLVRRDLRADPTDTYRWQNLRTSMAAENLNDYTSGENNGDPSYTPHSGTRSTQNQNAKRGRAGRLYTTGYDAVGKNVIFIERVSYNNYPSGTGDSSLPLFIDGGNAAAGVVNSNVAGTITAAGRAGNWAAVGYVSNGGTNNTTTVPVIAYYDETNDTLRLAYGSVNGSDENGANGTGARWTRRYVLPSSNALFRGSGKYVSLKVDRSNNIHLAFYNSTYNAMVYAVGTRTGAFTAQIVDNVIKGGVWTDIAVDNDGNPWITYGDMGRTGNYDGVRIAYKTTGANSFLRTLKDTVSGQTITGWEAVTMPAYYRIVDDRLNIEAWPPTNRPGQPALTTPGIGGGWDAAVGYAGTGGTVKQFRIGYFFKPDTALVTALTD